MSIATNISAIRENLDETCVLVAVSKTKPVGMIQEAYDAGQRVFGENRALELEEKHSLLPKDIEWHMIGHMQTNKVKNIAQFVDLIHSVDSLKLLVEINKRGEQYNRIIPCLLQFHIATETSKFGFDMKEVNELLHGEVFQAMNNIEIRGVMGMATFTDDELQVRREFGKLNSIFEQLSLSQFQDIPSFTHISMGMSGDYQLAIEEGSTMVRIGSTIFGHRGQ
jgi:hypothetical protein